MSQQRFRGISFVTRRPLHPVEVEELERVEQALNCRFPGDYGELVLRFGPGEFRNLTFGVPAPSYILRRTADDRARLAEFWFWNDSPSVWNQAKALESVACFDGTDGDDIRFHPSDPNTIYLLSHDDTVILKFTSLADIVSHYQRAIPPDTNNVIFEAAP